MSVIPAELLLSVPTAQLPHSYRPHILQQVGLDLSVLGSADSESEWRVILKNTEILYCLACLACLAITTFIFPHYISYSEGASINFSSLCVIVNALNMSSRYNINKVDIEA